MMEQNVDVTSGSIWLVGFNNIIDSFCELKQLSTIKHLFNLKQQLSILCYSLSCAFYTMSTSYQLVQIWLGRRNTSFIYVCWIRTLFVLRELNVFCMYRLKLLIKTKFFYTVLLWTVDLARKNNKSPPYTVKARCLVSRPKSWNIY